jgi:hypothetical protein
MILRFTALVAALLVLAGCGGPAGQPPELSPAHEDRTPVATPIALRIPSIKVDSTLAWLPLGLQGRKQGDRTVPIETEAGAIEVPPVDRPEQLGWYCLNGLPECGTPFPGDTGPAAVFGHINGDHRDGVFAHLAQVKPGATVEIDRADGYTAEFRVYSVRTVAKSAFPTLEVYGDTKTAQLRLISCGGELETLANGRRSYKGQVLVFAELTRLRPTELIPVPSPTPTTHP